MRAETQGQAERVGTQAHGGKGRESRAWGVKGRSRFSVHGSWLMVHDSEFTIHGSRFTIRS